MKKLRVLLIGLLMTNNLSYSQTAKIFKDRAELFRLERIKNKVILDEIKPLLYNYSEDNTLPIKMTQIPIIDTNNFYSTFRGNGVEVMINSEKFQAPLHSPLKSIRNYDSLRLILNLFEIDGHVFWGTFGGVPETKVHKINVKINGVKINIPDSATDGMYNPNFGCNNGDCFNFVYQSLDKKRLYIKMDNSDGAGYYQVVWIINDNKYYDRVIDLGP